MKDALVTEILEAFRSHSLKPIHGMFCLHDQGVDYTCPLVALAVYRGVVDRADPALEIDGVVNALDWAARTLGDNLTKGFCDGVDGFRQAKSDVDYRQGYEIGVDAARHLSPRDPPV